MKNTTLLDAWKRGTSPFNALRANSTKDEADVINLEEPSFLWSLVETFGKAGIHAQQNEISISEASKHTMAIEREQRLLESRAKTRFFDAIYAGNVVALGFEAPRRNSSKPIVISARDFQYGINWRDSTVEFEGLSFVAVRIVQMTDLSIDNISTLSILSPNQPSRPAIGRPTVKPELIACFNALAASGEIEATESFASQVPRMIDWLKTNCPDIHVPPDQISIKTFRTHLSSKFNTLKLELKAK